MAAWKLPSARVVEVVAVEGEFFLAGGGAERHRADRPLGHHIAANSEPSVPCTSKPVPANLVVKPSWNCAMRPDLKRNHAHAPIFEPCRRHAAPLRERHDLDRIVAEHEAQRVGIVHGDVEDDAAAGLGLVDAPALQVRRQIDGMEDARRERLADAAGGDRVAHGAMGAGIAQMMVGAHHHAGVFAGGNDHVRIGACSAPAASRTARACRPWRRHRLVEVQFVGGRDVDGVDVGREQRVEA